MDEYTLDRIDSICRTCCQHIEPTCRGCECGYCQIRIMLYEQKHSGKKKGKSC